MSVQIFVLSYLSRPTDLAAEMCAWPEFISGEGYSVELRGSTPEDVVGVGMNADREVVVSAPVASLLFDRVVGRVVYALSADTESMLIRRASSGTGISDR